MGSFAKRAVATMLGAFAGSIVMLGCGDLIGTRDIFLAPAEPDPNACVDTSKNPHHCGSCGHDCLGGACEEGQCRPVSLKSKVAATYIALDDKQLFWVDSYGGRVGTVTKDGKSGIDLVVGGNAAPVGLAVDETSIYFGQVMGPTSVSRCKIGGCGNVPASVSTGSEHTNDVAIDAANVYWLAPTADQSAATVMSAPKGASNAAGTVLLRAPGTDFNRIAADDTHLYVTSTDGTVLRVSKTGNESEVVGRTIGASYAVVVDDAFVYFTAVSSNGAIFRAPKSTAGGSATILADGQEHPSAIAVDKTNLYWITHHAVDKQGGTVKMCPLANCAAQTTTLANVVERPNAIAVDETAIYWGGSNVVDGIDQGGTVMRLAKP